MTYRYRVPADRRGYVDVSDVLGTTTELTERISNLQLTCDTVLAALRGIGYQRGSTRETGGSSKAKIIYIRGPSASDVLTDHSLKKNEA